MKLLSTLLPCLLYNHGPWLLEKHRLNWNFFLSLNMTVIFLSYLGSSLHCLHQQGHDSYCHLPSLSWPCHTRSHTPQSRCLCSFFVFYSPWEVVKHIACVIIYLHYHCIKPQCLRCLCIPCMHILLSITYLSLPKQQDAQYFLHIVFKHWDSNTSSNSVFPLNSFLSDTSNFTKHVSLIVSMRLKYDWS